MSNVPTMAETAADIISRIRIGRAGQVNVWTDLYRTQGGSFIVATSARATDDGRPLDLLLILPMGLGQGRVIVLWPAVNPELVEKLEEGLSHG